MTEDNDKEDVKENEEEEEEKRKEKNQKMMKKKIKIPDTAYEPPRYLRSSNEKLLKIPKRKIIRTTFFLVSWHHLSGTHCQPLREMYQHYPSSNLTYEPSCNLFAQAFQ